MRVLHHPFLKFKPHMKEQYKYKVVATRYNDIECWYFGNEKDARQKYAKLLAIKGESWEISLSKELKEVKPKDNK